MKKSLLVFSIFLLSGVSESFSQSCLLERLQQIHYNNGYQTGISDANDIFDLTFYKASSIGQNPWDSTQIITPKGDVSYINNGGSEFKNESSWITTSREYRAFTNFIDAYKYNLESAINSTDCTDPGYYFNQGVLDGFSDELCRLRWAELNNAFYVPDCN